MRQKQLPFALAAGLVLVLGLAFLVPAVVGEEEPQDEGVDPQAMQEWWMKMSTPGENHAWMDFLVGEWDVKGRYWMGPEERTIEGEATVEWMLGKRFVRSNFESAFDGMPFHGEGTMGFNNATKRYESIWMDDMTTFIMFDRGEREGDVITFRGDGHMPQGKHPTRTVLTKVGKDEWTYTFFHTLPGQGEQKVMELTYARKAKAPAK